MAQLPYILMPEILGYSPELLLDDLVNCANQPIYQCVGALEPFLLRWADKRKAKKPHEDAETRAQIEQGLIAFETLLESHVDHAFDFLETWSLRNIFHFNPELPIVVPHQKGLDLTTTAEQESELFQEIEELRLKIDNVSSLSLSDFV